MEDESANYNHSWSLFEDVYRLLARPSEGESSLNVGLSGQNIGPKPK